MRRNVFTFQTAKIIFVGLGELVFAKANGLAESNFALPKINAATGWVELVHVRIGETVDDKQSMRSNHLGFGSLGSASLS